MAQNPLIETLDHDDIQGLVRRGYGHLRAARFLLCTVADPALARRYLRGCLDASRGDKRVTAAVAKYRKGRALHVAFTASGLAALGVSKATLATFPRELLAEMYDRARVLGDHGDHAPEQWAWGRHPDPANPTPENQPIHVLLLLYAARDVDANGDELDTDTELEAWVTEEKAAFDRGLVVAHEQQTSWLPDEKEHFGFRDGIAKAVALGFDERLPDPGDTHRVFANGEFVLGYRNEYGHYTESPSVDPAEDRGNLLPRAREGDRHDLGKNGTYLVYRQFEQRVYELWKHLFDHSAEPGVSRLDRAVLLASKMVGRWPGGAPVEEGQVIDPGPSQDNTFLFREQDRHGLACPLGSHIRRTNPRDHLGDNGSDSPIMVRKHQLIRRGRTFGAPLAESMMPADVLRSEGTDQASRGLHFICVVGHIHRQFEFLQNAWVKSPVFQGLTADGDPIIGARQPRPTDNPDDEFTCPARPVRRKYRELPAFTRLVGGGYFFLPGLRALAWIASDR